ncbi:hypothetical protein JCM24511_07593 [Saitozyma sp. JCM 24511]|nr:hypothetical protein JCM24511_07593 [Saitozyma sp. JCM 24511]
MIPSPLALLGLLASTVIPTPVLSSRTHAPSPNAARNAQPQSRPRPGPRQQQQLQQMAYSPSFINATNTNVGPVSLRINTQDESSRNDTAPMLYGLMFEDISHSGDGGIYAELLMNRAFQGSMTGQNAVLPYGPTLDGWSTIGGAEISLTELHPLSSALPIALQVVIPANATGEVGVVNSGYWGMDITPQTYNASWYVYAKQSTYGTGNTTTFTASLRSNLTNQTWATSTVGPIGLDTFEYMQLNASIYNNVTAPNGNNSFALTMDASEVAGQTFYFALFSLFPETFKARENGLRKDLAQSLYDLNPKFLRCPGGNNLEGESTQTRWKWWEQIGPLKDRPGRVGDWGYYNTGGLGLVEFMHWCEDMEVEPVLAVYSGYSLDGTSWPQDHMDQVLQEALEELEYLMGDESTNWGKKRVEHGFPEPFQINWVEIGNEDWFSNTYPRRFKYMYDGLKKAYPNITYISTAYDENPQTVIDIPAGAMWDTHHYVEPSYFVENFNFYDNWLSSTNLTDVQVFIGEYSVFEHDTPSGVLNFSDPQGIHIPAIGEGVYLLGAERNPNTVRLSSYAPSLQNRDWFNWTPDLISFQAEHNRTVRSVSYWQEWMFGNLRGSQTLEVIDQGGLNPLFWGATIEQDTGSVYLKVINIGNQTVPLDVSFDASYTKVNGTILRNDDPNAFNWINNQTAVVPQALGTNASALPSVGSNGTFTWTVPTWSITVLQFDQ